MAQEALLIISTTAKAIVIGFLPAIFWLWFWLKEDPHPEPRRVLLATFFAGMLVVPIAMFFEEAAFKSLNWLGWAKAGSIGAITLFIWAFIEEFLKYFAARQAALKRPSFDEPVDAPIYLITAAIGFAALENVLFLFKTLWSTPELGIATGEMRFLGATLLHIITSAIVGLSIGISFFKREKRARNLFFGILTATLLHGLFNLFIINSGDQGMFRVFALVWVGGIILLLLFERIKRIKKPS